MLQIFNLLFLTGISIGSSELLHINHKHEGHQTNLHFVGSFKKRATAEAVGSSSSGLAEWTKRDSLRNMDTSYYFLSNSTASWNAAVEECKAILGEEADLISFETKEELDAITKHIETSEPRKASAFWTSGKYNQTIKAFIFSDGNLVPLWVPWDTGYPQMYTPFTRVTIHINDLNDTIRLKMRTYLDSVENRYICELKPQNPPDDIPACPKNDLIVVADVSKNLKPDKFPQFQEFLIQLVQLFTSNIENRVSVITYGDKAVTHFGLDLESEDGSQYTQKLMESTYLGGNSQENLGLDAGLQEFTKNARQLVPMNLVLITSGPIEKPEEAKYVSDKLRNSNVTVYVIQVGYNKETPDMLQVVQNKSRNILQVPNVEELQKVVQPLENLVCV